MRKRRRPSLSSAPFHASLLVILALAVFIGIFWAVNEYQTYQESILNIEQNYKEMYQTRVKEEVNSVLDFIAQRRSQADLRIENQLRTKVQSAYTIASHIYRMYREEKDVDQLRSMVAEILRPIRWNNGLGYYFAGRIEDDRIDLFANDPLLEGQSLCQLKDQTGKPIALNLVRMLKEKGAGIFRHQHTRNDFTSRCFPGITFVKYFKPFDWYIGAGISSAAMEKSLQEEILATLQGMRFDKDGHILCFRFDGTIISHQNKSFIGRSISDLIDTEGKAYGQTLLDTGLQNQVGGHLLYRSAKMYPGEDQQRLSFIKAYREWGWILAADISMEAMSRAIQRETETYTTISFKNVFIFIGLFAIAVLLLLSMAYYHSIKIKHGISLFTDFFRKAAHTQAKIRDTNLAFSEFEDLGRLANTMVDDRIQQERILHRDELRLDTLLQLGAMEEYSINDKYDFVLHRIVQITGSTRGYIALVNRAQTHTTLCSRITLGLGQVGLNSEENITPPRPLSESGIVGNCINRQEVRISNNRKTIRSQDSYPYSQEVERRVDVPISNNNKVVLVAGVCNSSKEYDNSDVRQMTMLLEGIWLHVLKTCSEKEMANLERQIIAISEEERSKIGRDLHDDLGSHLSGVEILSKVLQQNLEEHSPEQAKQLTTIRKLIREAIEKTRWLSRGLYPVHVIEHGLETAIEELVAEIEQLYPVHCRLSFDRQALPLAGNIAPNVYYIIREALFNAVRHGRPDTIRIIILRHNKRLSATIIDDGLGLSEQGRTKGMGLHTMQYRAKAIGATLDIQPGENNGTVVTLYGEIFS